MLVWFFAFRLSYPEDDRSADRNVDKYTDLKNYCLLLTQFKNDYTLSIHFPNVSSYIYLYSIHVRTIK